MFRKAVTPALVTLAVVTMTSACSGGDDKASTGSSDGKSSPSSSQTASPSSSSTATGEPRTLEAAVKAQQETSDRFTSGDYAGAWDGYSATFQNGISRDDYDKLGKTCDGPSGPGFPIKVVGVRLEGSDKAIVRLTVGGYAQARTMSYQSGHWRQEPNPEFATQLGKPLATIIAHEKAEGQCSGGN